MDGEISDTDVQELTEADKAYLFDNQSEQENPNAEEEEEEEDSGEESQIIDPYVKKRALK